MSFPGGIQFTNSGFLLSSKTLIGKQVVFTRLAVGDGELGGQSPLELTGLIHEVESIEINKLQVMSDTEAVVGGPFTNQGLSTGFWWREIGLYATDPDTLAEKLYCYGNAGALADYIPAGGGAEILEKQTDIWIMASATDNIAAEINSSLVYASAQDLTDHVGDGAAHGATVAAMAGTMMLRDAGGRVKVADPVDDLDAVNKQSLTAAMELAIPKGTNSSGTDAYALTIPGITAYTDGLTILMRTAVANTAAATLDLNTLGVRAMGTFKAGIYAALSTGAVPANSWMLLTYSTTANAGAGAWIIMNVMDADLLDGQHGSYYLAASAYTAADVLSKLLTVDGPGSGLIADQVDGLHFRNTSGYLEYSTDGVVWNPVGLRYIKASDNSKFERLTEMTHNAATGKLRAVFYPPADGTIKITFDAKVNSGTGTVNIASYVPLANMEISAYDGTLVSVDPSLLVEGTAYSLPSARVALAGITETSYTAKTARVSVKAGIPVAIYQSATMTVYTQNLKVCYDEVYA